MIPYLSIIRSRERKVEYCAADRADDRIRAHALDGIALAKFQRLLCAGLLCGSLFAPAARLVAAPGHDASQRYRVESLLLFPPPRGRLSTHAIDQLRGLRPDHLARL